MELTVATHVGFCFGVRRAVTETERLLDEGKAVCTLGPVIHNPQIVESLAARGAHIVAAGEGRFAGGHLGERQFNKSILSSESGVGLDSDEVVNGEIIH